MNDPAEDVVEELKLFGGMGFDFADLAIEGPGAAPETMEGKVGEIKDVLSTFDMFLVAHCPWYFDIGHPYERIREAYLEETKKVLETASKLDVEKMGLHILSPRGLFKDKLTHNLEGIKEVVRAADDLGIKICIENLEFRTFSREDFRAVFNEVPMAMLLFDIGHANLGPPDEDEPFIFLQEFRDRLAHVHAHDNMREKDDLHLPIGAGAIDWERTVKELKKVYDGTITLEIHAQDRDYLSISREKFLALWNR